jgi:hypothetical protein
LVSVFFRLIVGFFPAALLSAGPVARLGTVAPAATSTRSLGVSLRVACCPVACLRAGWWPTALRLGPPRLS